MKINVKSQMSNVRIQMSNPKCQMAKVKCKILRSKVKHQMSDVRCQMSDVRCQMSACFSAGRASLHVTSARHLKNHPGHLNKFNMIANCPNILRGSIFTVIQDKTLPIHLAVKIGPGRRFEGVNLANLQSHCKGKGHRVAAAPNIPKQTLLQYSEAWSVQGKAIFTCPHVGVCPHMLRSHDKRVSPNAYNFTYYAREKERLLSGIAPIE